MLTKSKRLLLFSLLCIPLRIILSLVPIYLSKEYMPTFSFIIGLVGVSMIYMYANNQRMNAYEGGGDTWWAQFRLLHGALFLTAAIYAYKKSRVASLPLFIDACTGLLLHVGEHNNLLIG